MIVRTSGVSAILVGLALASCSESARTRQGFESEPVFEEVAVRDVVDVDMLFVIDNS